MKTTSRMFMGVAMVAFTLLSCNDSSSNPSDVNDNNIVYKVGTKQPPDSPTIIRDDVQKWMNEQLASKSNEKMRVSISEMYPSDLISGSGLGLSATIDSKGNVKYFLEDREISAEEYNRTVESTKQNTDIKTKRNLSISGVIYEDSQGWIVLVTAEQIVELSKKYDHLLIEFEGNPQNSLPMND